MPAGGETLIAGEYLVAWSGSSLGIMEGDTQLPTVMHQNKAEPVANTSKYGKSTLDAIYQGADYFAQFTCLEYKAATILAWWPFSATQGLMGIIGRLYWGMSASLVLTAISGTTASAAPTSLTATKSILAPGFNTQLLYGPTLRKLPIRMQLFPDTIGGNVGWYSTT